MHWVRGFFLAQPAFITCFGHIALHQVSGWRFWNPAMTGKNKPAQKQGLLMNLNPLLKSQHYHFAVIAELL